MEDPAMEDAEAPAMSLRGRREKKLYELGTNLETRRRGARSAAGGSGAVRAAEPRKGIAGRPSDELVQTMGDPAAARATDEHSG